MLGDFRLSVQNVWDVFFPTRGSHNKVAVKALLDSRATGLSIDTKFAKEKGFKLERLKNPLLVQNVNGTINVGRAITHQVECNIFFKEYVERV